MPSANKAPEPEKPVEVQKEQVKEEKKEEPKEEVDVGMGNLFGGDD